ncbi:MAG: hypothetical protein N5P05_004096 (plasmid) [Chroococcopsis gigantea SAG 12.99]|nr:hypothetical protein [Chroococcopsis gigantea SAG 12.99]
MDNSSFNEKFDAIYNARISYRMYRDEIPETYYDPSQDLPPGIHADINRVDIPLVDDDEDEDDDFEYWFDDESTEPSKYSGSYEEI